MKAKELHRWDVTPAEARQIQEQLRVRVELDDRWAAGKRENRRTKIEKRFGSLRAVAGADVAFDFRAGGTRSGRAIAAVIVYAFPAMEELERACGERELKFPYVPGLLSFREIPALLAAFGKLRSTPDVVFCDGQGYAHPRRFGLASHLGVLLDCVTVGCAKSRLIGEHAAPGRAAGSWTPLNDSGEIIGAALRTREAVKPIYVSQGHRISLPTAMELVMAACDGFRLPKPTREADHFVEQIKRERTRGRI